ncbi:hypothetical protein LTR10_016260 [Elasticomyces elasticus]|uniref:Uncharacterized protein n=1 Tax=Exophiala sideris TaxID=1016849 RepID=A0ABR0JN31_9EURO|nr:hypothetical protein LTR10_016260 [Elasticomyces elasticus]KAK5037907.1 hypothetical protein LTS07_001374 [Exophiala sideris]KAK5043890.1 hypothetical protein LTR13_000244 [Exophiala sideris]KAK5067389.1 hypothetical protein LTR69_001376 [Exophiala sideris]KAK5182722.1 hypothetical protein LTR44_005113 [Eurotiomycetes sp. CCFEE 6388]
MGSVDGVAMTEDELQEKYMASNSKLKKPISLMQDFDAGILSNPDTRTAAMIDFARRHQAGRDEYKTMRENAVQLSRDYAAGFITHPTTQQRGLIDYGKARDQFRVEYNKSERGKAAVQTYRSTERGKEVLAAYRASDSRKESAKKKRVK